MNVKVKWLSLTLRTFFWWCGSAPGGGCRQQESHCRNDRWNCCTRRVHSVPRGIGSASGRFHSVPCRASSITDVPRLTLTNSFAFFPRILAARVQFQCWSSGFELKVVHLPRNRLIRPVRDRDRDTLNQFGQSRAVFIFFNKNTNSPEKFCWTSFFL